MNASITELKIRARLGLKALQAGDTALLDRARAVSGLSMPMQTAPHLDPGRSQRGLSNLGAGA
jgi:hypothetical protein